MLLWKRMIGECQEEKVVLFRSFGGHIQIRIEGFWQLWVLMGQNQLREIVHTCLTFTPLLSELMGHTKTDAGTLGTV